jgi:poly-beta-1,6-N-acetyl-D-glucosamine synthase
VCSLAFLLVGLLAIYNMGRLSAYLIGSNLYRLRAPRPATGYTPSVTLIAPVHNESLVIERTLQSLMAIDYDPLTIVIADDGSTDNTLAKVWAWKRHHDPGHRIKVFSQPNGGKANVLNHAIDRWANTELVMCLDGDSMIAPDAVAKSAAYFADPRVESTASNVQIMHERTLVGALQYYEYLVNHHMKKAQTAFNLEYIIGGIGSMFRRSTLSEVGLYDTNTMTEDIDLTLKLLEHRSDSKLVFAADSLVYTEACPTWRSLIRQRMRWKYGRMQAFYKHRSLFFSRERKWLGWFALPNILLQEVIGVFEPLSLLGVLGIGLWFGSPLTIVSAIVLMTFFNAANIAGNSQVAWRRRVRLAALAPAMYLGFYLVTAVEYVAALNLVRRFHKIPESVSEDQVTWRSPERSGVGSPESRYGKTTQTRDLPQQDAARLRISRSPSQARQELPGVRHQVGQVSSEIARAS